jgi:AraC family transcriptional regulator
MAARKKASSIKRKTTDAGALGAARFEAGPALLVAGIRRRVVGTEANPIPAQWKQAVATMGGVKGRMGSEAYGVAFGMDEEAGAFDYLAGIALGKPVPLPLGWSKIRIPAQKYAVFTHKGHVSGIRRTMTKIFGSWLPGSAHALPRITPKQVFFFERYGRDFNPSTGRGGIEIWLPIL